VSQFAQLAQQQQQRNNPRSTSSSKKQPFLATHGTSFGLYRSPAWSSEEDDVLRRRSMDDESADWQDISPVASLEQRSSSKKNSTQDAIDIRQMNALFQNGCTLSRK